jgi:hypothetical protein
MDPKRQSTPEAGAYDLLRDGLDSLRKAERALAIVEAAAPDPDRAVHLGQIRAAIAHLVTFVRPVASA